MIILGKFNLSVYECVFIERTKKAKKGKDKESELTV